MKHHDQPEPSNIDLALYAIGDTCTELAAQGCGPAEVASALASFLGVVTAAIGCCPKHAAQSKDVVIEIFEDSLATHRARFAAFNRVGDAGMHHQGGHA